MCSHMESPEQTVPRKHLFISGERSPCEDPIALATPASLPTPPPALLDRGVSTDAPTWGGRGWTPRGILSTRSGAEPGRCHPCESASSLEHRCAGPGHSGAPRTRQRKLKRRRELHRERTQSGNEERDNRLGEITASNMTKGRYASAIKTLSARLLRDAHKMCRVREA